VTVDLVEEYKDVFSGLGKLRGVKVKLHVEPDAKGAVQKQRRIPTLRELETRLNGAKYFSH